MTPLPAASWPANDQGPTRRTTQREQPNGKVHKMNRYIAPWLAAAAIGGAIALAPIASADTDPLVPYGTDPHVPSLGYHESNHDEANTTNGFIDVPF
jgi:hypothetical protein